MVEIQDASASSGPVMDDPAAASLEAAMQVPVTVLLGPMGPLLRKLHSLMAPGQSLASALLSVDDIRLLSDDLKDLCISLKNMSEREVDASFMARWWMKIVRELCYDTEDHLDAVYDGARAHHHFSWFFCCCGGHFSRLFARATHASEKDYFSGLLARAKDASESLKCVNWPPKTTEADWGEAGAGRLTSLELVHVEPPNKLVELLDLDDNDKQTLKVIPINGCSGVGKTTAARALYHRHAGKFQCRAFVTVSRNPDMRGFLTSMLSQLKAPRPHGFPDVPNLIDAINRHLQGKRYFIIIDDLWTAIVWNIISRAFPRGDYCSRIITTTQIDDVALACCSYDSDYLYKMEPLNDHESRKLFFGRVFGSEDACPTHMKEVSYEIIRKCGGLPLAVVSIASLLASQSNIVMEKWKHIEDSLPSTPKGMKDVQNLMYNCLPQLMYNSLPLRLRTCLLYLSMYAHGYVIKKDELVKQWVAEDFLSAVGGRDTVEIAGGYFDELVSRGIIQAVDTDNNGEVLSCTVHRMVLDFIRHKSMEGNFIITVDYFQSTLALTDKVRRLSVQFGGVESAYIPESIITSHVRSLIFWGFFKCVPCITDYGLLRVLILHIWADRDKKSFDLTTIGKLFQLKYLKIECNITVKLPGKIGWLQHLGTLQVDARLSAVPSDIVRLESLLHLRLPSESILPSVVGQLTSLRTLGYFDISSHSEENVMHLGELTNLQDLQLTCSTVQPAENLDKNVQLLGSILEKLSVLQSVSLVPAASGSSYVNIPQDNARPLIPRDGFGMVSPPPTLERLKLSRHCWIFSSLPEWIGDLVNLCILKIAVGGLSREDIDVLKGLPSLTALTLYIQTAPTERIVINKEGFQVLTYFKFMCAAPCLSFVRGAMPNVQKLTLGFNSNKMKPHCLETASFRHLTGLIEISVKFGAWAADKFDGKAAESALEAAVSNHPNSPIIRVQHVDVIFDGGEDKSTTTEGKEKKLQEIQDAHAASGPAMDDPDAASLQAAMQLPRRVTRPATSVMLQVHGQVAASTQVGSEIYHHMVEPLIPEIMSSGLGGGGEGGADATSGLLSFLGNPASVNATWEAADRVETAIRRPPTIAVGDATDSTSSPSQFSGAVPPRRPDGKGQVGLAVLGAVVPSIGKLLKYEWGLTKTVKDGVASLQAELREMLTFLQDVSSLRPEQLNPHVKNQAWEVRELNIDTKLHSFMVGLEASKDAPIPLMSKVRINHEMEMYIKDTRIKIEDMREQHGGWYPSKAKMLISQEEKSSRQIVREIRHMVDRDNWESSPVGLDGAIDEVTKKLSMADLVSIAGMGGMGKTTLARAVYDKMKGDFDCKFFVHIGQRPDMQKILKDIYKQIQTPDEDQMKKFLEDKRCLFVLDDIWHEETWNLVEPVFKGSAGSKIITTSRNHKIAEEIGGVAYQIKPLSPEDSRKLLLAKAQPNSHDDQVVSDEFLHKCDGLPLAITMIGSLLAKNPSKGWRKVYDPIKFDDKGGVFEHVKKVLSSSYLHLPLEIKECVLYLSLFPEGRLIEKNMLIWMWIADGLVNDGSFELGESYFNELLDRSMVQRAMSPGDVGQGGCRVHSLMLDLIRDLSSSENFSTVLGRKRESTSATRTIHRLAIHQTINQTTSLEVEQVRSFFASMCPGSSLPPLSKFAHVRAIHLETCDLSDGDCELKHLGKLEELKYVGLVFTPIGELPAGKGYFKVLQTLDVTGTGMKVLLPFVEDLRKLRCLRAGKGTRMMGRVGKLTSLEELWLHSADKSPDFAAELQKLTKLRVLVIHFDEVVESMQKKLVESLGYLNKLQVLQIWFDSKGKVRLDGWEENVPYPELRQLLLFGAILSKQTPWIHHSSAPKLSKLLLHVETLTAVHLEMLGKMPSLRSLYLIHSEEDKHRLSYTANKNEFKVLEYLNTNIELICGDGGLPMIQELEVGGIRAGRDVGLRGNMPLLEKATYHLDCEGRLPLRVQKAEEELRQAGAAHPNRPAITIRRWNNVVTEMWHVMELIEGTLVRLVKQMSEDFDDPGFVKQMSEDFARAIGLLELPVGEPPVLRVDDATDATGSPSQGPALFVNLFNKLLHDEGLSGPRSASSNADANLAESSSAAVSTIKPDGTGSLLSAVLSWLKSPDGAAKMSEVADKHGMDPVAYKRIWKKCVLNPELITIMENLVDKNDVSEYMRLHGQLMDQEILDYFSGHDIDEPSSPPGYTGRGHADNLLSWLISLYGAARASALVSEGAAKFEMDPAAFKIMLKKYVLNPKLTAAMESAVRNNDRSEFKRLMAQVMEPSSSRPPKHTQLDIEDTLHLWRNTPEGAAAISKGAAESGMDPAAFERILKKSMLNPELIAAMDSAVQDEDDDSLMELMEQLMGPETMHYFTDQYMGSLMELMEQLMELMEQPWTADGTSTPGYADDGRARASSTSAPLPENRQPSAAQVDADSMLSRGGPANASDTLSGLSSDPALAAQSDMIDAVASSTPSVVQSGQDGEDSSTIFNLNERLAIMEKALAADESSGKRSSAQVDADSVLSRGGSADASDTLSGLSSDPALAAQPDMIDAVATSTPSVAQSGQGGEISTAFNLNELLAALEKAAAAGESSGQPSSAQPDNVGHEEGGGA